MTPPGAIDGDGDDLEALRRLISADSARLGELDLTRDVEQFFGRSDTLDLLREVAREEQLRKIQAETITGSVQGTGLRGYERARVIPMPSLAKSASRSSGTRPWRNFALAAAAALVVGIGLNWSAASGLLRASHAGAAVESRSVVTRTAQLDTVNLPDGSSVILAPNSSLRYAVARTTGPREVALEGEAYFDVEHDDARPFRVQTRHAVVEDLGTTFVVREYAGDRRARVTVRSGAAALHARDGSRTSAVEMRRGDGAYVDSSGAIVRFSGDPESYGSWTTGRLVFDAAPLPDVLSRLASWYGVEFQLTDSTLAGQYFTGAFDAVPLPQGLEILGLIVHASFEQRGREVIVTPRPGSH